MCFHLNGTTSLDITAKAARAKQLHILSAAGQLINSYTFTGSTFDYDLSAQPSGIYIAELTDGEEVVRRKVIK